MEAGDETAWRLRATAGGNEEEEEKAVRIRRFDRRFQGWFTTFAIAIAVLMVAVACEEGTATPTSGVGTTPAATIPRGTITPQATVARTPVPTVSPTRTPAATLVVPTPTGITPTIPGGTVIPGATIAPGGTVAPATSVTLRTTTHPTLGTILVDGGGRTLYMYVLDMPGTSVCEAACAMAWPPLTTTGTPMAGTGVNPALIGTITRTDGSRQVTYNDHPLYYYRNDQQPGQVSGQGVSNVWYVLGPDGEPIEMSPAAGTP
jgi:predicted lipoprotein with Yx(FWY)xxD motif